jgi:hypothetical protein
MINNAPLVDSIGFTNLSTSLLQPYLVQEPASTCTSALGAPLIALFFAGLLIVYVGECVLPSRRISALLLCVAALCFFGITFGLLVGLQPLCPSPVYRDGINLLGWLCLACALLDLLGLAFLLVISARGHWARCIYYEPPDTKKVDKEIIDQMIEL